MYKASFRQANGCVNRRDFIRVGARGATGLTLADLAWARASGQAITGKALFNAFILDCQRYLSREHVVRYAACSYEKKRKLYQR